MTLTSSVLFLGFADFGVGNGLTASIADSHGREDAAQARRQISSAFFFLLALAVLLMLLFAFTKAHLPWATMYGLHTARAIREASSATTVLLVCTALNMPLGVVQRVQLGYQRGYVSDLWMAAGNAVALAGILFTVHLGGPLPLLVAVVAGIPMLMLLMNWNVQFLVLTPTLRPHLSSFDAGTARQLAAVGSLFFVQQCFGLVYYLSDNIVIAHAMGAQEVARFAVLQRIFSLGVITQYLVAPLWPAVGEALARQDFAWASRAARRAVILSVGLGITLAIPLLLLSRTLALRWSGMDPGPIDALRIGFALWVILVGYIATMNALLNQPALMKRHLALFGAASLTSLLLKILAARSQSLPGVVWATVIAFGVLYVVPASLLALRAFPHRPEMAYLPTVGAIAQGDVL